MTLTLSQVNPSGRGTQDSHESDTDSRARLEMELGRLTSQIRTASRLHTYLVNVYTNENECVSGPTHSDTILYIVGEALA